MERKKHLLLHGIVDDFKPYIDSKFNKNITINQLMSPQSAIDLIKKYDYYQNITIHIKTDRERASKIDGCMSEINEIYGDYNVLIYGDNHLPYDISGLDSSKVYNENDITRISTYKVSVMNIKKILNSLLYSFTFVVVCISSVNIFNAIYSSITLRRKEIASLKSIGMSNKQVRKMFYLEGFFYGIAAAVLGVIFSEALLFILYIVIYDTKVYFFTIQWVSITESIIIMYAIIFFAIIYASKENKKSIIENVKDEII